MTFEEALSYLGSINRIGMSLGTERMQALVDTMGRPDKKLKFIHIAGTNGKGSTSAFCAEILRGAGLKVGLFTSPHLIQLNERIQINGQSIPDQKIAEGVSALKPLIEQTRINGPDAVPTYFEALTALALWYFESENVNWVVFETGLGGRFDATNVVTPEICILTSLSIDHEKWLGSTIPIIANEKAGIIKSNIPVVITARNPEAVEVFTQKARELNAPTKIIGNNFSVQHIGSSPLGEQARIGDKDFVLSLIGSHQADNAAGAVIAIQWLREKGILNLTDADIEKGLLNTRWPGRFQVLQSNPPLVVDGGHNLDGVRTAVEAWRACFGNITFDLVCGFVGDKNHAAMLEMLLPLANRVTLVKIASHRSMAPEELLSLCGAKPVEVHQSLQDAWPEILEAAKSTPVFICGSLYLVGEALALHTGQRHQLFLNERLESFSSKK